jgi:hypothetical protein
MPAAEFFMLDTCPFFSAYQGGAYAIQFANGAIFAFATTLDAAAGFSAGRSCMPGSSCHMGRAENTGAAGNQHRGAVSGAAGSGTISSSSSILP